MRTRNSDTTKSATPAKRTPPSRKSAAKTPPNAAEPAAETLVSHNSKKTKRASSTKAKQVKTDVTVMSDPTPGSRSAVEAPKTSDNAVPVTPVEKTISGSKRTRKVIRNVVRKKTPSSTGAVSRLTPKLVEAEKTNVKEDTETEELEKSTAVEPDTEKEEIEKSAAVEPEEKEGLVPIQVEQAAANEEPAAESIEAATEEDQSVANCEEEEKKDEANEVELPLGGTIAKSPRQENPVVAESSENQEPITKKEDDEVDDKVVLVTVTGEDKMELENEVACSNDDRIHEWNEDSDPEENVDYDDEKMEDDGDHEVHEEVVDGEYVENDLLDRGEQTEVLEEEQAELTAAAEKRKIRKELEIFVGGLDRDAVEEDVKKAFENIGEVVEARVHKDISSSKNKGYAFVKFATKEQASRALSEMRNPVIREKRCGTAPCEDNDTLFLGNICNSWTKEAIKQKLKDYGINGVPRITLVADAQREGLSRGFAFLEFSCHTEAMLAYKRLQKPDVIFGHPERTAKVAFAEPLRELDPEVMVTVKSVFVDGLPPHWDEDRVREHFNGYGDITRITLARNMSTAKRKDFGFVDFSTHEAAVSCIGSINNKELRDGNTKTKVKARLSNPLPKTQAVKGGMCGGFRIGRGGVGNFPNFGRGGHSFNRANLQRGQGFYQHGRGQMGRMGFPNEYRSDKNYPHFHGRPNLGRGGGRWAPFRDAHHASYSPWRSNFERTRLGTAERGQGRPEALGRQSFSMEEEFNRPFVGRHVDDLYFYDRAPALKRPFFMTDQEPDFMEPSQRQPRLDYSDPAISLRGTRYRDTFGEGSSVYPPEYYSYDYGDGAYSSFYGGGDHPRGAGYFY